jgi:hypothetical protein
LRQLAIAESRKSEGIAAEQRRRDMRSDCLYIAGAVLVVTGIAMLHGGRPYATIAAGAFCLLLPCSEILMSFIRGLRLPKANR